MREKETILIHSIFKIWTKIKNRLRSLEDTVQNNFFSDAHIYMCVYVLCAIEKKCVIKASSRHISVGPITLLPLLVKWSFSHEN